MFEKRFVEDVQSEGGCSIGSEYKKLQFEEADLRTHMGVCSWKGFRQSMEDTHSMTVFKRTTTNKQVIQSEESFVTFFVVADGHGGNEAAKFAALHLPRSIFEQPCFEADPEAAILEGFAATERAWFTDAATKEIDGNVGTTITVAMVLGNFLYLANLGDTDAVIYTKGGEKILTEQHIPANPSERARVRAEGGLIIGNTTKDFRLGHPVWNSRLINLGVTRAFGDLFYKNTEYIGEKHSGLSGIPSISKRSLIQDESFIIIATDGLWEVVTPAEAVLLVAPSLQSDSTISCRILMEVAKSRGAKDNTTILLVKFNYKIH